MSSQLESLRMALVDRYALERELGDGGMATVYVVRDLGHAGTGRLPGFARLASDCCRALFVFAVRSVRPGFGSTAFPPYVAAKTS